MHNFGPKLLDKLPTPLDDQLKNGTLIICMHEYIYTQTWCMYIIVYRQFVE